jgi:DNA-binding transcriptional MocR family regulator
MKKHAALLRPKFEAVSRVLETHLGGTALARWTTPRGGYFVSLDTPTGTATEVVRLAEKAGVKLTPAGATFPYGKDPYDRNIRIAPTMPTASQVETAMEVVCACILLVEARRRKS